eukprot:CAMPEP_0168176990 /NCGR_PEP_ID=MMETSP0139_2-20121125/8149_1 /TAXON_ID=44445 /ORGANISM="Pseudo-nitzschia australis, Strain 10249 10 AB" /LENGTH=63 /DNA_ID=CAMNT_0008095879 /DNA_START=106 /DNA_END=295 /DNA_ORIENTATION=-
MTIVDQQATSNTTTMSDAVHVRRDAGYAGTATIDDVDAAAIKITANTSFPPSATGTPQQLQPE